MNQQPSTSHRSVAFAAFFLVLTLGLFAGAFYFLDGASYVADLIGTSGDTTATTPPTASEPQGLQLPDGMSQEFALRIWQEQVDSQEMIGRLVSGEIASLRIDRVEKSDDSATLHCTVRHKDGADVEGIIVVRRFGENWYVSYATAGRDGATPPPTTPLPQASAVDTQLLSAIIAENIKSQDVLGEYLDGIVKEVFVDAINPGPSTTTLEIEMDETHGQGFANLVAIERDYKGQSMWFLASFTKTGHNPPEL